jgi:hypothetical protein
MLIADGIEDYGKVTFLFTSDLMQFDVRNKNNLTNIKTITDNIESSDTIIIVTSLPFSMIPYSIRIRLGNELIPKGKVYRYRVKRK